MTIDQSTPTFRFDSANLSAERNTLPTSLGSQDLRNSLAADVRARSFFFARGSNLLVVSRAKELIEQVLDGEMDRATARWQIKEILKAVGYTPQGGFPEDLAGDVPPAEVGSLQDLSSDRRLNFMIDTQIKLMQGRGQQLRGNAPAMLRQFPAWELVRVSHRRMPRNWGGAHEAPPATAKARDPRPRWIIAGGKSLPGGRLIALKGDPVWGELGASGNFDDALDVDYPPFAFNSGMGWQDVSRADCLRLGVTGPNGESIEEWQAMDHPLLVDTQSGLPAPQISLKDADPALVANFLAATDSVDIEGIATPTVNRQNLLDHLNARRLAREAAFNAAVERSSSKAITDYLSRP